MEYNTFKSNFPKHWLALHFTFEIESLKHLELQLKQKHLYKKVHMHIVTNLLI